MMRQSTRCNRVSAMRSHITSNSRTGGQEIRYSG
jgi:hypothetical protein